MFQLALFRAIEALEQRSIDQVISLLKNFQSDPIQDAQPSSHPSKDPSQWEDNFVESNHLNNESSEMIPEKEGHSSVQTNLATPLSNVSSPQEIGDLSVLPEETQEKLKNLFHIEK
jgi:hypothetical protein